MSPGRPPPVALDDLAAPRFDPATAALLEAMDQAAPQCPLDPATLCAAATARTGLVDFGDPGALDRLSVLCRALEAEGGLSGPGVVSLHTQLVQLLVNRLLLGDLMARHPEIAEVPVERPIIICGLPRTGTTHLHNLLAADPALRSLPYWESVEPVLAGSERPAPGDPDPRPARAAASLAVMNAALPHFARMHEMTVDHAHEEIQLLAIDVSTMLFETMALVPSWRDAYRRRDQTPSYRYLRSVLQALTWLRGGTRWVLKSPQHLEQFGPLLATFPDATFVITHRDPVPVTVSMATMVAYTARLSAARVDPRAIGRYWSDRVEDLFRACTDQCDALPPEQVVHVRFDEFMADDLGTVVRIYEVAGQPLDRRARTSMARFVDQHPRGRHGTVVYDPAAVGIDPGERAAALAFYARRFGVPLDGR